jgi:hypothetical protein
MIRPLAFRIAGILKSDHFALTLMFRYGRECGKLIKVWRQTKAAREMTRAAFCFDRRG